MVEETPTRMAAVGYRILNDQDEEMDLSPVPVRDRHNVTIDDSDEDDVYHRRPFRGSYASPLFNAEHAGSYFHLNLYDDQPTVLNGLNFLNVVTYLVHLFVSYGIGVWGLDGLLPTRWEISQTYETLVTPAKYCYYIWAPILAFEAVFAVAQLLKDFRSRPIVQEGTGYFFFYTCLIQTAWTLFFSFQLFIPSFVSVVLAFASLASLLVKQHYSQIRKTWMEYWLFRFPFFLHCGWMAVMVVVHFSLLCRQETSSIGVQLSADIVALAVLLPLASFLLWSNYLETDFVIPSVIIWAYIGIAWRLQHPDKTLLNDYGETVIDAVQLTAYIFAGIVTALMIPRMLLWVGRRFLTIQVVTMQEESLTGTE